MSQQTLGVHVWRLILWFERSSHFPVNALSLWIQQLKNHTHWFIDITNERQNGSTSAVHICTAIWARLSKLSKWVDHRQNKTEEQATNKLKINQIFFHCQKNPHKASSQGYNTTTTFETLSAILQILFHIFYHE